MKKANRIDARYTVVQAIQRNWQGYRRSLNKQQFLGIVRKGYYLSSANYFNVFCHVTLKNHISGLIYSSISSYTSLEREKNTLSKKKYFGRRKPIIFRHRKIKKANLAKNFFKIFKECHLARKLLYFG